MARRQFHGNETRCTGTNSSDSSPNLTRQCPCDRFNPSIFNGVLWINTRGSLSSKCIGAKWRPLQRRLASNTSFAFDRFNSACDVSNHLPFQEDDGESYNQSGACPSRCVPKGLTGGGANNVGIPGTPRSRPRGSWFSENAIALFFETTPSAINHRTIRELGQ